MNQRPTLVPIVLALLLLPQAALAQQAAGFDIFVSDDADDSEVVKFGANFDFKNESMESYQGIRLESASFAPLGQPAKKDARAYYRFADGNEAWKWNGMLGTDGHTWLGNAAIHNEAPFRQEYFIEREIIETPTGLDQGLHYTFAGAAYDLPINDRNLMTAMVGVQDFTGDNLRLHARARYIHVLKPDWGLSAQLRMRYWHDSHPREYDYYAPGWYAEVIPTLQLRRYRGGWQYLAVAGYGRSKDAVSDWRAARYLELGITSPDRGKWYFKANAVHSNTPVATGYTYRYTQFTLSALRRF
ncbi:hypothetical protein [Solilutibacter tolerans]|uniref:Uncharacterized protein n=1 Tax=Solilutibacter tolerans TaxID=1604334 RepID=A0A1N6X5Q7_9GAMM|nr:hypothetical protein [Lysobacter tolerans]SIQ97655.1 hypothetical protein SAMN05421546_2140 [Lysobacter tolerans]